MSQAETDATEVLLNGGLIVNPNCKPSELMEDISAKLHQLDAGLHMTYGCGGESFRAWRDDIQDGYMWGLRESVAQIDALWRRYVELMKHEMFAKS